MSIADIYTRQCSLLFNTLFWPNSVYLYTTAKQERRGNYFYHLHDWCLTLLFEKNKDVVFVP